MALKKTIPILLFFYAKDISQEQAENIQAVYKDYDVYFRKVVNNTKDVVEPFAAVAGDVPAKYIAAASAKGLKVFDYEFNAEETGTVESDSTGGNTDLSGSEGTTPAKQAPVTPAAPADALKPSDAPKPTPAASTAPPPPPAPSK